ncbi:MAG: hypothetical protein QMB39_06825, partial [Bacteroidales bacterium]
FAIQKCELKDIHTFWDTIKNFARDSRNTKNKYLIDSKIKKTAIKLSFIPSAPRLGLEPRTP